MSRSVKKSAIFSYMVEGVCASDVVCGMLVLQLLWDEKADACKGGGLLRGTEDGRRLLLLQVWFELLPRFQANIFKLDFLLVVAAVGLATIKAWASSTSATTPRIEVSQ